MSPARLLALLAAVLLALAPAASPAQVAPDTTALAGAALAFDEGRYDEARQALARIASSSPAYAEAQYLLARVYFERPDPDAGRAYAALAKALRRAPANAAYLTLKLRLEQAGAGMTGLPLPARRQRRLATARSILRHDPANPVAHEELGRDALDDFLLYRYMLKLSAQGVDGRGWQAGMRSAEGRARFSGGRFDVDALWAQFAVLDASGPAGAAERDARRHLRAAADAGYRAAYAPLAALEAAVGDWPAVAGAARAMQARFPDDPAPHLWAGLAAFRHGDPSAAEAAFARAFERMDAAGRGAYDDPSVLLSPDEAGASEVDPRGFARRYWLRADPRLSTPHNERRLEHYARRVEADLFFGSAVMGLHGSESARGQVWIRYGAPLRRALVSGPVYDEGTPSARYDVWEYDDFRFVFDDPGMVGEYRTYSPPAHAFASPRTASQAEADDYVAHDRRLRREQPERTQYAPPHRAAVPLAAAAFKGDGGAADVVVAFGVPPETPLPVETSVFALAEGADSLSASSRRTLPHLPAAPAAGALRVATEVLALPPGRYEVAAEFEAGGGAAVGYERAPVTAPAFDEGVPALSDLLLAYAVEETGGVAQASPPGQVVRRGHALLPAPGGVFAARQPVYLYFETYGFGQGADGRTDYEVAAALVPDDARSDLRRAFDALLRQQPREGVSARFAAQGAQADEGHYLALDASALPPGAYTLLLHVRDRVRGAALEAAAGVVIE